MVRCLLLYLWKGGFWHLDFVVGFMLIFVRVCFMICLLTLVLTCDLLWIGYCNGLFVLQVW